MYHKHICHDFFIHSSVKGYFVCFYMLAVVNSATVVMGVHITFQCNSVTLVGLLDTFLLGGGGCVAPISSKMNIETKRRFSAEAEAA